MTQAAKLLDLATANDNAASAPARERRTWNWRLILALAVNLAAWAALAVLAAFLLKGCF